MLRHYNVLLHACELIVLLFTDRWESFKPLECSAMDTAQSHPGTLTGLSSALLLASCTSSCTKIGLR